ncbi:CREB-regulated transcription coactivator 1-like isoform X2 [Mya arenaria]|uniref:CREB-regulated transcription coactivator 1-like isoform X2 n=1 Tax=Mya arenaria TaxID=6604 RepID=UPI0022E8D678|nr:CREB-regulated transcription coactivator 1-like isoform X2 [Mya arenaria]
MANPRKFSEKIALHNQKQAEETAAFEAILRDVSAATRSHPKQGNQQLHIQQNIMQQYRGGSLPNVNQMVNANAGIDLQTLQQMEGMRGGNQRVDRMHPRDRGRQVGPLRSRPFNMEKNRADCSPYGTGAYLSPPPDTSWRRPMPFSRLHVYRQLNGVNHLARTNSDSAIHASSSMGAGGDIPSPNTPPMHRRIQEVVGENSGLSAGYPWDPKKLQQRPKSCEVPNINIYPSAEQESQMHIPIGNNTGSLPDLTILQFPSPLTTPLDLEEQVGGAYQQFYSPLTTALDLEIQTANYANSPANLSPTSAHHMAMGPPSHNGSSSASPGSQRRRMNASGPSPLVLTSNGNQSMRVPLSPPVASHDPSTVHTDPRIQQQYMLYMRQQQQRAGSHSNHGNQVSPTQSPLNSSYPGLDESPRVPPPHMGPVPQVCVTSHEADPPEGSLSQYRNNISEGNCQSPTSPHSQTSYSPSQSPGMPPQPWGSSMFDDTYHLQQQQTTALQQQFEHFNMHQPISSSNNVPVSLGGGGCVAVSSMSSMPYSQAVNNGSIMSPSQEFTQRQNMQQFYMDGLIQGHLNNSSTANSKIPDIILSGMSDGSFDADFFGSVSDEALKDGLVPLDLDGLQMLTDPNMIADADTENSFKLDQL